MAIKGFEKKDPMAGLNQLLQIVNQINQRNAAQEQMEYKKQQDLIQNQIDFNKIENNKLKNKRTNQENLITGYGDAIKSATSLNELTTLISTQSFLNKNIQDNPVQQLNKIAKDNELNEKTRNTINYQKTIDNGYAILPNFNEVFSSDENKKKFTDTLTLSKIQEELRKINNFKDAKSIFNPDGKLQFVSQPEGLSPKADFAIENDIDNYKSVLETALVAIRSEGTINDDEMFFVLTGDKKALESRIEDVKKNVTSNIKNHNSSINAIEKFKKTLAQTQAKQQLKGSDTFNLDVAMTSNALIADMTDIYGTTKEDINEVIASDLSSMDGMTYDEIFTMYDEEARGYAGLIELEKAKYYRWTGNNYFALSDNERKKQKQKEKIRRELEEL